MKTKAVIFDFDGTLTVGGKGSCSWERVWKALNDEETDYKFYTMFKNGEIDNRQWNKLIEDHFRKIKVQKSICDGLAKDIVLMPGIKELFDYFKTNDIKIHILSGGVKNLIDQTLADYVSCIESIRGYDFEFENDIFVRFKQNQECYDEKHLYVEEIKNKYKMKGDEILFVGNGSNDETVYKTGARTLCINPDDAHYDNKLFWHNCIKDCNDITEIIPFVNMIDKELEK